MFLTHIGLSNEVKRKPFIDASATIMKRARHPDLEASTEVFDHEVVTLYVASATHDLGKTVPTQSSDDRADSKAEIVIIVSVGERTHSA